MSEQYPLMTSNNVDGDTATQGFNTSVMESADLSLAQDAPGTIGLRSTGADVLAGVEWYPDNDPNPQESQIDDLPGTKPGDPHQVQANIRAMRHQVTGVPGVRIQSPNKGGTLGFFFPAPNGSASNVLCVQVLTQDSNRYRVVLHPWVASGTAGQIWIGSDPGNVVQTANGNISTSAFPLNTGGVNASNMTELHWSDDMWAALDYSATVDTYLFVSVERYA